MLTSAPDEDSATDESLRVNGHSFDTESAPPLSPSNVTKSKDSTILPLCTALAERVSRFLDAEPRNEAVRATQKQTRVAMGVVDQALERYSLSELSISYNGGKDCLVLLILFLASLSKSTLPLPQALESVYIISPHPFAEVDTFVDASVATYHLALARYAMPMKAAFARYLSDKQSVKAIFVGTRRTDPHGEALSHFDLTDHGWPGFMRVHPVIDWHYTEIWTFIRELEIPYCELYDMGYTSLGGTTDTYPNPALLEGVEGGDKRTFRPAYELIEDRAERLGRLRK